MRTREQLSKDVTDLYRLAFLITARRDLGIELAADALAFYQTPGPSFPDCITGSARVLVMAEALMAIGGELAASARRTESSPARPNRVSLCQRPGASIHTLRVPNSSRRFWRSMSFRDALFC